MRRAAGCALAGAAILAGNVARANGRFPSAEQLVVCPGDENHIAVQVTYGFIHTRDGGGVWYWSCEDAAGYGGVLDPPIALLSGGVLIAGVFDGLAVSTPDMCSYAFAGGDLAARFFVDVAASKTDPTRAIAISSNGLGMNQFDTRVWETSDTAASWAQLGVSLPADFLALTADAAPSDEDRIYVSGYIVVSGDDYRGSIARTSDRGATWEVVQIPASNNMSGPFLAAVDPVDPDTIYLRKNSELGELVVSRDGGDTWQSAFTATSRLLGFALSPDGTRVLVGTETDGIHAAATSDLVFSQVSTLGVRCLTWTPTAIFACAKEAIAGFTIGKSTDGGATFTALHHLQCLSGPDPACPAGTSVTDECIDNWAAQKQILQTDTCTMGTTSSAAAGGGGEPDGGDESGGCCGVAPAAPGRSAGAWLAALGAVVALARRARAPDRG